MKKAIAVAIGSTPEDCDCTNYNPTYPTNVELSSYMSYFCEDLLALATEVDRILDSVVRRPKLFYAARVSDEDCRRGRMTGPRWRDSRCRAF